MVSEVRFTKTASKQSGAIFTYIDRKFGLAAAEKFAALLLRTISSIQANPEVGSISEKFARVRKFVFHELCILYYRHIISQDTILIVDVWDTRRNPAKRKY